MTPDAFRRPLRRREFLQLGATVGGALCLGPALTVGAADAPAVAVRPARTLQDAMQLAGQCCMTWLDPAHDHLPWGGYEVAHDVGRWWNVMPRLAAATGFAIPPAVEAAMRKNLQRLTDNEDALLLNSPGIESLRDKAIINLHNLREGMLAFGVLAHFRQDEWARERGRVLVETIAAAMLPNGGIDVRRLKLHGKISLSDDPLLAAPGDPDGWFDSSPTTGRCLEALVYFHVVTGDARVLAVARRLAQAIAPHVLATDGRVRPEILAATHVGHNHSYLGTLRGLLDYGLAARDPALVDSVLRTYRRGLRGTVISESGWTPHDLGRIRFPNNDGDPLAETGSCADAIQLALTLARRAGQVDLFDDVERWVRCRVLPAQIVDDPNPRRRGGWGVHGNPHGRGSIFDVFAAVLATLIEVRENAVVADGRGVWLHLHFPVRTDLADVEEIRSDRAVVTIRTKRSADLHLRIPAWTPANSVRLATGGKPLPLRLEGNYAQVRGSDYQTGQGVELSYELPLRETVERMPVSAKEYRLTWRGDEVVRCQPSVPIWPA